MSKKNNDIKIFTAADIIRYQKGTMLPGERNALEKAALEDAFLADAIEGYSYTASPENDLKELRERLTKKTERGKVVPISYKLKGLSRIAALFVLILAAGWGIYQLADTKTTEVALQPETKKEPVTSTLDSKDSIRGDVFQPDAITTTKTTQKTSDQITNKETDGAENKQAIKRGQVSSSAAVPSATLGNSTTDVAQVKEKELTTSDSISAQSLDGKVLGLTVRGQVTDLKGAPVPFATISQPTTRQAISTDLNGRFQLSLKDTTRPVVSAAGFETQRLAVTTEADQKVMLRESNESLQEVVVTGLGQARKRSVQPPATKNNMQTGELEPVMGWSDFNTYLTKNLRIPDAVKDQNIKGEVLLSFEVNRQGNPINIAVDKSLCAKCDEEAIRLLKEGPKWKSKKGKKGMVRIHF